jgi:hypothetical protein
MESQGSREASRATRVGEGAIVVAAVACGISTTLSVAALDRTPAGPARPPASCRSGRPREDAPTTGGT